MSRPKYGIVDSRDAYDEEAGERANDSHLDILRKKVSTLRQVTIQIGEEANEQNRLLGSMGLDFEGAKSMLSRTMKGLQRVAARGGSYVTTTVLFCLLLFFFGYWFLW